MILLLMIGTISCKSYAADKKPNIVVIMTDNQGYVTLAFVAVHLIALGLKGWLAPKGWHGGMPPISLVALALTVIPLFIKKKLDHEKRLREGGSEQNENEE